MTNLTDTDRTNIYSYRGTDFDGDLMAYLMARGIDIRLVELREGNIIIMDENASYAIPQYASWVSIALYLKGGMEF